MSMTPYVFAACAGAHKMGNSPIGDMMLESLTDP